MSGDQNSVMTIFSLRVQTDPGSNPASYTKRNGSFSGIKRPERGVDDPHPSNCEVKEGVEIHIYSLNGTSQVSSRVNLPLY